MMQQEVAARLVARPGTGDYGVLGILVSLDADVRHLFTLPPSAFRPAPKVTSAVVRLTFRPPPVAVRDRATLERLVRQIFTQRRKTLLNALKPFAAGSAVTAAEAISQAGLDPGARPETLQLFQLATLADVFSAPPQAAVL
jgi:16S rRNA (adenine1518-N6/adenine1519-N6)-dimethyltransferase